MMKWMLLCAATIAISGCETTRTVTDTGCQSFSIIQPSRLDTMGTKRQVLAHNNTWRALCTAK